MALILTPLATDNFSPNANPLNPANWTTWTDGATQPLRAVSGVAIQRHADVGVNYSGDYYSGIVVPNDMYITATLADWVPANGPEADFYFRSDTADSVSFYDLYLAGNGDSTSTIILIDQNGGIYYEDDTAAISAGDVFTVAVVGQNLYLYQNGVLLTNPSTIGTGPTSGVAGLFALASVAASDAGWSNFIIGSAALGGPATNGAIFPGPYYGANLAAAFPHNLLDIFQVVNEGGKIVWNLSSTGVATVNPTNPTNGTVLGQFSGSSFAQAFAYNPDQLNVFQLIGQGGAVVFHVDYQGNAVTP